MNAAIRLLVRRRARGRCEYCLLPETLSYVAHHIDHILAVKHGGSDLEENLALACSKCSLGKSANLASVDFQTGKLTRLFHPRKDRWHDHFEWVGPLLLGISPIGRATVHCLNINDKYRIAIRRKYIDQGLFPPVDEQGES